MTPSSSSLPSPVMTPAGSLGPVALRGGCSRFGTVGRAWGAGAQRAGGEPCSAHVPRRRPYGRRLLLYFAAQGTPPARWAALAWARPARHHRPRGTSLVGGMGSGLAFCPLRWRPGTGRGLSARCSKRGAVMACGVAPALPPQSGSVGCPPQRSKGGGRGRRTRPGDMSGGGHPADSLRPSSPSATVGSGAPMSATGRQQRFAVTTTPCRPTRLSRGTEESGA